MRLLLDTHVLLWAVADSTRLPPDAQDWLEDARNEVFYSAASTWEIVIKASLGRKDFRVDTHALIAALDTIGFTELPVSSLHALAVATLPPIHHDPFDRLLLAQSLTERLTLVTHDRVLERYDVDLRLV